MLYTVFVHRPSFVGVLNVTPDSYFDGGKHVTVDAALKRAGELLSEGADIIEIGGESTGPNSKDISVDEELSRTIPVIDAIAKAFPKAFLSIDTYKSAVASETITHGVRMINDVTAGRSDPKMFSVAAKAGIDLVLMYAKDPTPRTTIEDRKYDDVIAAIRSFLLGRISVAEKAGVKRDRIVIDPGLGHFVSADAKYSFQIIEHLSEFTKIAPVFISPSRKSFLAGAEKLPTESRLPGTIAATAICALNGASFIRTHDVLPVRRACEIAAMINSLR